MATLYGTLRICGSLLSSLLSWRRSIRFFRCWIRSFSGTSSTPTRLRYREYSSPQFIRGRTATPAAVGVALVCAPAKNFQDYFVNVITQKVGARIYTMAFDILWISRTRCLRISAAAKLWGSCSGTERCREVHRTAGEYGVHEL